MRSYEIGLSEDTGGDIRRNDMAESAAAALYGHLWKLSSGNSGVELDRFPVGGKHVPGILMSDVHGVPQIFWRILVVFNETWRSGGKLAHMNRDIFQNVNYVLFLDVDDASLEGIVHNLASDRTRDVVIHELTHYLDFRRRKGAMDWEKAKEQKRQTGRTSNGPIDNSDEELSRYYNDPMERNAFFHNIAQPLLTRLSFAQKQGLETFGMIYGDHGIDRDFKTFVENRLKEVPATVGQSLAHLAPKARERTLKRLYQVHKAFFDMIDEAKAVSGDA